jgi:hypothetical protein
MKEKVMKRKTLSAGWLKQLIFVYIIKRPQLVFHEEEDL